MSHLPPIDAAVAELLRENSEMTVSQLAKKLQVTATAVRQRLGRLMDAKLVEADGGHGGTRTS